MRMILIQWRKEKTHLGQEIEMMVGTVKMEREAKEVKEEGITHKMKAAII